MPHTPQAQPSPVNNHSIPTLETAQLNRQGVGA